MFTIRKYEAQYQNRLLQFLEICLPQSDRKFEPDGRHKMYRNVLGYFEHFWCLFDGEDMIGTAALKKLDSGRCELKALYLLEKYHKKGLGRRLFKLKTPGWNKAEENRSTDMEIRAYRREDIKEIAELFYNTVHTVNAADYTEEQLDAWADGNIDTAAWDRSFREHRTLVAVMTSDPGNGAEQIVGFADMDGTGYLDRLYVHKDFQRRRIASALCDRLEQAADVEMFTTHASVTAKPFFEKRGYQVVQEQQVERKGILLTNYVMKKGVDCTWRKE